MNTQNINRLDFLFNSIELNLGNIAEYLKQAGFNVKVTSEALSFNLPNGPTLSLSYSFGEFYLSELPIKGSQKGTNKKPQKRTQEATRSISTYSSKIEVQFDDLDKVLNQTQTLSKLKTRLKEWQEGIFYKHWTQAFE